MANEDSQTFGIVDLFALMTLCALAAAFAAPFIPSLGKDASRFLLLILVVQVIFFCGAFGKSLASRQAVLKIAGEKWGRAYTGNLKWRHWPVVYSLLLTAIFVLLQLGFAIVSAKTTISPITSVIYNVQLSLFGGHAVARYLWRAFPGTLEFYEGGIILSGVHLCAWDDVQLRPSKLFADRIVVVLGPTGFQDTKLAHIGPELRDKIKRYVA